MTPEQINGVAARARCLYCEQEVEAALDRMGKAITARLRDKNPIFLCVLNGGLVIAGKLATRLQFPLQIGYLHATRYRGNTSGAALSWQAAPSVDLMNRVVLVVDDILDEGATLQKVVENCRSLGAEEVYTAVLVNKRHDHKLASIEADFVGVETEDHYLFGYGMDFRGYLRNAAGIYAVDPEDLRDFSGK